MDKNTITGLVLIAILLVGFSFLSRPSKEQLEAQQRYYDSIALVQQREEALKAKADAALANGFYFTLLQCSPRNRFADYYSERRG